jgi:hypothetical protein
MMKTNPILTLAVAAALTCSSAAQGALLITEFMPDPSGTDAEREWVEIYNSGTTTIDLTNYKIGDEEAAPLDGPNGEGMFYFPAGATIAPGQVFTIANTSTGFTSLYNGLKPTFEFNNLQSVAGDTDVAVPDMIRYADWATGPFSLSNENDQVALVDPEDNIIDRADHGNASGTWPKLGANQSYERVPADQDTNAPSDFIVRTSGNATPGVVTLVVVPEPGSVALLAVGTIALLGRRRGDHAAGRTR